MFGDFLKRLTAPQPAQLADHDARLALGALLVRIARADDEYAQVERQQIRSILNKRYSPEDIDTLMADCEALEEEAPDTVRFTRAIKAAVAYDDRLAVITAMWEIVLADGVRDADENSMMRMVAPMLGVQDQDSNLARIRVQQQS